MVRGGRARGPYIERGHSSNAGLELCYVSVTPRCASRAKNTPALFRDTHDDSMENRETWALSYAPTADDILSQLISILTET